MTACSAPDVGEPFPTAVIEVGDVDLRVWVADESSERRQGLMGVEALPDGVDGMLFAYEIARPAAFHMKDTVIPLDIWWFDGDGALLGSARMEPCTGDSCVSYGSPGPVRWVLETPAGSLSLDPGAVISTTGIP